MWTCRQTCQMCQPTNTTSHKAKMLDANEVIVCLPPENSTPTPNFVDLTRYGLTPSEFEAVSEPVSEPVSEAEAVSELPSEAATEAARDDGPGELHGVEDVWVQLGLEEAPKVAPQVPKSWKQVFNEKQFDAGSVTWRLLV